MRMAKKNALPLYRSYLREWRKAFGLSQEKCAEIIGLDRTTYLRKERGELPYTRFDLELLAAHYKCLPGDLLLGTPQDRDIRALYIEAHPEVQKSVRRALGRG